MTVPVSNAWYSYIGNGRIFGVPVLVIITAIACLIMHYLLSQTRFGQHTYAMGASKAAASRAGINIKKLTMKIYFLSAVTAGIAGSLYSGRFSAGAAQAGEPLLLDSIAAVVIAVPAQGFRGRPFAQEGERLPGTEGAQRRFQRHHRRQPPQLTQLASEPADAGADRGREAPRSLDVVPDQDEQAGGHRGHPPAAAPER